jgi:ABC-type transporter Mla MlaB component
MTTILVLRDPIARGDIPALCDRVRALLESGAGPVGCDVGGLSDPDAVTVDALARLELTARTVGHRLWFSHASDELQELLALVGLCCVLRVIEGSSLEPVWQAEEREQMRGVEEEADAGDPIARDLEHL